MVCLCSMMFPPAAQAHTSVGFPETGCGGRKSGSASRQQGLFAWIKQLAGATCTSSKSPGKMSREICSYGGTGWHVGMVRVAEGIWGVVFGAAMTHVSHAV